MASATIIAGQPAVQVQQPTVSLIVEVPPDKKVCEAYILGIPLGWLGAHQFYLGRSGWGTLYLFTLGLLGIGWVVDLIRMPCLVHSLNKERRERAGTVPPPPDKKRVDDAYILCIPFGWLGLHHFYLGRPGWGCLYMFTLGIFGIGWLFDICRLPCLVNSVNAERLAKYEQSRLIPDSSRGRVTTVTVYQTTITNTTGVPQPQPPPPGPAYPVAAAYPSTNPPGANPPPPYSEAGLHHASAAAEPTPPPYHNPAYTQQSETAEVKEKGHLP